MLKALITLITALPEILLMIKKLDEFNKKQEQNKKVKDDIKRINKAFEDNDAEALNRLFRNEPDELHSS